MYACGHSRGAKLATLAALQDTRIAALGLLDPVDLTYESPPDAPSAVAAMKTASAGGSVNNSSSSTDTGTAEGAAVAAAGTSRMPPPLLVVGAGRNKDCIPAAGNYAAFYVAAPPPAALLTVRQAGHLQFLDTLTTLQQSVCGRGRLDESALREVASGALATWGAAALAHQPPSAGGVLPALQAWADSAARRYPALAFDASYK